MAYNPYGTDYNVRDPLGTSPSQRLATALAGTTLQNRLARNRTARQKYDTTKGVSDALHKLNAGYARRGLQDSGLRKRGMGKYFTDLYTSLADTEMGLEQALFDLTAQNIGAYNEYFGTAYGREFDAMQDRAERAAQIREASY
tara:strand:+ start:215 stop:643 length:429 start_codon:yes stop_codon:yes gene_type:complete